MSALTRCVYQKSIWMEMLNALRQAGEHCRQKATRQAFSRRGKSIQRLTINAIVEATMTRSFPAWFALRGSTQWELWMHAKATVVDLWCASKARQMGPAGSSMG